jgi:hypothetical protein
MPTTTIEHKTVTSWKYVALFCGMAMLCGTTEFSGQSMPQPDSTLEATVQSFESPDWEGRAQGFYHLFALGIPGGIAGRTILIPAALNSVFAQAPSNKERVSVALIALLIRETAVARGPDNPATEGYWNYLGDIVAAVADLHDKRSVDALLAWVDSGQIAARGLAALGRDSIDPLLRIIKREDRSRNARPSRAAATMALADILDPEITQIDDATKREIKIALLEAARDDDERVRLQAVRGFVRLADPDVTVALAEIAASDAYHREVEIGTIYPVRDAAQKALAARDPAGAK